jgi:hypothetical protein
MWIDPAELQGLKPKTKARNTAELKLGPPKAISQNIPRQFGNQC